MADYPKMFRVRQKFEAPSVADVAAEVRKELSRLPLAERVKPGQSVAITAGSRGIANIHLIIKATVDHFKSLGAKPFIVPAMGSHGGGTAQGPAPTSSKGMASPRSSVGCPIKATHGDGDRLPDGRGLSGALRPICLRGRSRRGRGAASSRIPISSATSKAA